MRTIARDCYETTVALPDAAAGYAMKSLASVKVSVVPRGASDIPNSLVDIFPADTGLTKGPDPKTGATGTNPFTTGVSGAVRFWAEGPAEYDLVFEDLISPARFSDRIGWNSIPAKAGSMPTSTLKLDNGIRQQMLSSEVQRQQVAIGMVDDWWRPSSAVAPPDGYEICDGRIVTVHDFVGFAGPITTPDLRNLFILGADVSKDDGTGASGTDGSVNGPGIRGVGGAHQHVLSEAELAQHGHPATAGGMNRSNPHYHIVGGASFAPSPVADTGAWYVGHDGGALYPMPNSQTGILPTDINHEHAITVNPTGAWSPHNNMPKWIGLLKVMKCRRY